MRFIEVPALITEDIEDPNIVDITEDITASINGTTLTIDGDSKVSGEVTITLTNDVTVNTVTTSNIRQPSIHKIIIKTNGTGNFTYVPNDGVTASSVSTTTKTGSDLDILLITTSGGDTYLDLDLADYVSPAANFSNVVTGFKVSELTSTYGTTAKLYKPDGTLLTTVNSAATESGVNFGYTESSPGDVIYKLEVTDDLGRKSTYNLPRKWINYAMETTSTPGFQKFALSGNDYTTTVTLPSLGSSSKARIHKTTDHGYMGINFKIQGRNSPSGAWVDIDSTAENVESDESAEFLAFGDYLYHRVWVKPTAKATTTVSSSNVVTLTLSNVTEDVTTKTITGADPFEIDETSNVFVFEEPTKIGSVPYSVTVGTETYTNAVTATTEEIGDIETKTFHTDVIESNILYKHLNRANTAWQVSGSNDGNWITYSDGSDHPQFYKGSPESGYTLTQTVSNGQGGTGTLSYDGLYHIGNNHGNTNATLPILKRTGDTFAAHSSDLTKHASVNYGPIAWSPNSYNFAVTDSANEKIYFYEFDSSDETWSTTWNSGSLTSTIGDTSWFGRMSTRLSKDGEYLVTGDHSPENTRIFKCDWTAQTVTLQHTQTGNSGAAAIDYDGEYVIAGYNSANTKILKRSGTTWTDVTTSEGFTNLPYIRNGAQFLGVPSQYLLTGEYNTPGQTANQSHTFMYKWKGKKEVTLAFANPTLTLTGQNVTISSAKLYKDDVLFHTYGTESNVVLRSDQTGTYQAIVNDVYYSNRVTPDLTTTRSVSAPQLEFDGYNKLHLSNITPTSTTLGVPDGTTRDLTTQSNVYIYKSGTYTANVQTSDTFAYLSNVATTQALPTRLQGSDISAMGTTNYTRYGVPSSQSIDVEDFLFNSSSNINPCIDFIHLTNSQDTFVFDLESVKTINKIRIYAGNTTPNWASRNTGSVVKLYNGSTLVYTSPSLTFSRSSPETYYGPYEEGKDYNTLLFTTGYTNIDKITVETPSTSAALGRVEVNDFTDAPSLTFDGFNKLSIDNITQTSSTITYPNGSTVNTNTVSDVYIKDIGEYALEASDANTFVTSNVEVGALDTVPGFTAAFHHGAFSASDYSSAYSTVAEAATAGFVYSDTPAGDYTWGTLEARVKERENPDFTANSTLHTDYSSTYGWTNSGWAVSADSQHDNSEANYGAWKAFDKLNNTFWHSNHSSGVTSSTPATLTIQYPSSQVIKSYNITSRNDDSNTRFPSVWKLQGYDGSSWVDVGSEQTVTTWTPGATKRFDVSDNTTAYTKYQLRITTTIRSASATSTSDFAAIAAWKLYTLNNENNTVHDDHTEYTYTPPGTGTITANVLRVAGGGAGGNTRSGGGGAGGLLYSENVSVSGAKKIVVGNGGKGKIGNQQMGDKGHDTLFEGLTTVVGGGSAAGERPGTEGGSSGGNSGRNTSAATAPYPSGQGNAGGTAGADNFNGAGGGGAGGVGANQSSGIGGIGLDYSSVFGTTYGESGWFAGGGGGGGGTRAGGQGGGGDGTQNGTPGPGQKHTGGGSGGKGNSENTNKMSDGGSGIVLIKKIGATNPPTLNFDGYNKLSIDNIVLSKNKIVLNELIPITSVAIDGTASNNVSYANHAWKCVEVHSDYLLFDHWNTSTNALDTTNLTTRQWKYTAADEIRDVGTDIPYRFRTKDSSGNLGSWYGSSSNDAVLPLSGFTGTIQHTHSYNNSYGGEFTWPGHTFSNVSSEVVIKKDGAAFATTTSNTVYIRDTGTYTAEVKGSGAYVTEVSKVVSVDITEFPNYVNATSFYYGGGVVDNTGKLYTWGHNGYGDSGRGASDRVPTHLSSISDPVSNVWRGTPGYTMAAKTSTDKWYMWGRNTYSGVLGNTTNTGNVTAPEDVTAKVTTYFGDQTVSANKIIKMAMGEHHAAALTAGGKVWSWGGDATYYATGTGTNDNTVLVTPVQLNRSPPTSGGQYNGYKYKFYMDRYSSSSFTHMKEDWDHNSTFSLSDSLANFQITNASNGSFKYSPWLTDSAYETRDLDTITFDSNGEWTAFKGYGSYYIYIKIIRTVDTSGYLITNTNSAVSTLKIRANGSIFTFNSQTCWYYDRLAGSNDTWYTQQLGYVPSTNTFIEASISGNPDQVYHNKTSSNVTKGSITVPPEGILLSNDPSSWDGAALFANPFTSTSDPLMTGITNVEAVYHGTAALDSSGNVWFWGGASTSMQYAYPTKLLDSSSIPGIVGLRATNKYSLFTWKSDGTFYTRGAGTYGQLATGSETDQYASWQTVTTLQGKTIKRVFGGNENMFVWTNDGVYGVGRGNNYKNGDGSTGNNSVFAKSTTLSALSIKEIDFGHATGLVITTDGKGYMWGEDANNSMANALSGNQSGAAEATSISALSLVHIPSPSITYDGKNKLTVGGTNYADTSIVTYYSNTYNLGTAKTMYVKDIGDYVFKISGTDKYVESNVHVSSVDLAGAPTKPIDFDGYNKLTLISPGANAVSNVTYFSNTYELGSANVLYINGAGTYDLEMSGSNVFALSSNVVGTVSQHPTDVVPSLTFDNYNKLTLENFTTPTLSDVNSANASVTKVSGGGTSPDASSINSHVVLSNGDKAYHYNYTNDTNHVRNLFDNNTSTKAHGTSLSAGEYYEWGYEFVSSKKIGSMTFKTWTQGDTVGNISIYYYDGTTWKSVVNPSALGYDLATEPASYAELEITFSPVTATHFKIWVYAHPQSSSSNTPCISEWTLKSYKNATLTDPNGDTYSLGQTQNDIYIKDQGDYFLEVTNSDQSAVVKTNVGTIINAPSSFTAAFHYGAFSTSDYSGAYSTVDAAATAGFVYSDTTPTTYTWGTLNSIDISTTGQTGYSWTPPSDITADVLMVAGGGGGGDNQGGGGGAGGLVYNSSVSLSGSKTIVVGDGGEGGYGQDQTTYHKYGLDGRNTSFSELDTAIGGGGGGGGNGDGRAGGSGGGADNGGPNSGGSGISDQGFAGGNQTNGAGAAGGGGAGSVGETGTSSSGGDGGLGINYTSTFGTTYGDSGWFASGGGGGIRSDRGSPGTASQGGGTSGLGTGNAVTNAQSHTGGGGGGSGWPGDTTNKIGGDGGSGIVIIRYDNTAPPSPSLTFDTYNKLSIENLTPNSSSLRFGSNTYEIGTASNVYIEDEGTYKMATGDATTFALVSKQVTIAPKPDFRNIWAGEYGGMVIDSDGKLYTWGNDGNNQSGRGASDRTPTHISTISDPVSNVWVEGATGRTRIVKTSTDKWYMWGMNLDKYKIFGQTGDQATPVDVTSDFTTYFGAQGTSDSTRIIKVVTSASACSALAADGKVWSWGVDGNRNELGNNTTNGTTATPFKNITSTRTVIQHTGDWSSTGPWDGTLVSGAIYQYSITTFAKRFQIDYSTGQFTKVGTHTSYTWWKNGTQVTMPFTASEGDTIKLDDDSTQPPYDSEFTMGPLGTNTELSNITDICCLHYGKLALDSNGDVWQWGTLRTGSTGYPTKQTVSNSYVNISLDSGFYYTDNEYRVDPNTVQSSGYVIYTLYHLPSSTFASSGHNIKVQLSNNTWSDANSGTHPDTVTDNGTTVSGTRSDSDKQHQNPLFVFTKPSNVIITNSVTIIGIGAGYFTAYAWDAAGTIYSIGQGTEGQLGNGANVDQDSSWQTVTTLQGKTIYGIYGAGYSVFAHTSDGVYACGQGTNGRLGMGDNNNLNVFTKSTTLSALSIYKLDFGHGPGYIITTDGKGYALGYDYLNSIPTPLSGDKNVPTEASSLTNLSLVYQPPSLTYDTSNKLSIENFTPTSTTLTDPNGSSFDIGTASNVYIRDSGKYSIASKDANTFVLTSNTVTGTPTGTTYVYDSNTFTTPSQVYDNTKTITVKDIPTDVVGKIYKGSTAYTIHTTTSSSNVIIKNTGTYVSVFTTATQAFLTNAVNVNATPTTTSDDTTIEDAAPIVTTTVTTVQEQEPETFSYTGVIQTYTVPDGVTSIKVKCWGAAGGSAYGGAGGYAGGDVSVTPGDTIQVVVGQGGRSGGSNLGSGGGFTGILSVWNTSDIAATHAGSIIIAGAGGGSGATSNNPAGNGGGETGGVGQNDNGGAKPGTQTAAGSGESDTSGATNPSGGSYFRGGNSAGNNFYASTPWPAGVWGGNWQRSKASGGSQGGGGGGGYYGAGGAGNRNSVNSRGAAGGSGYIGGDGTHEVTNGENLATSLTQRSTLPPKTDDEHYVSGAGTPATTDTAGGDGLVVIIPTKEVTTTTTTGGIAGSTAVPTETTTDTPSAVLDVAAITTEDPILDLDFTTTLPRNLKRYNTITNSSIGARFNRHESKKKRIEKSINTDTFSIELTANNASSPTTLTVTVANSKFVINGDETPTLGFIRGETYTFDQSDASNDEHPLVLATSEDGATQYTTGWVNNIFTVPYDVPDTLYYKCTNHPNMGGEINTTFGNAFSLGDFTVAANTHVSGEYTLATNFDGTTSNLYVNGDLITQTTPTIAPGAKTLKIGEDYNGLIKNLKFWNKNLVPVISTWGNTISGPHTATIPFTSDSTYDPSRTDLRYNSTINTDEYLHKVYFDGNNNSDGVRDIKFKVSTRKWMDAGTGDPDELRPNDGTTLTSTTINPEIVEARNSGSMIFKFINPYYDSTRPNGLTYSMSNN